MKQIVYFLAFVCSLTGFSSFAQQRDAMTREEKQDKNNDRMARINKKNDYALFRRQVLALKEYADERKKIATLQKNNAGMPVKVIASVDSNENDDDAKTLVGYIQQIVGDNVTNMYEISYDRAQKKIVTVKRTPEAIEADNEMKEEREERAAEKKPAAQKAAPKKKGKDEEDEDDPDEEKPSKTRHKEKDED